MDSNPRHFFLDVTNAEVNVDASTNQDFVTIEFAGHVTPAIRQRLTKAIEAGEFEITVKKLLA
jgi:hypothetical protein